MKTIEAIWIGHAACNLQASVGAVQRTAELLRLQPVLTLDGIPHFNESQIEKIRRRLKSR